MVVPVALSVAPSIVVPVALPIALVVCVVPVIRRFLHRDWRRVLDNRCAALPATSRAPSVINAGGSTRVRHDSRHE